MSADVNDLLLQHGPTDDRTAFRPVLAAHDHVDVGRGDGDRSGVGGLAVYLAVLAGDDSLVGPAELYRVVDDRLQDRRQIECGAVDRLQDLADGCQR